MKTKTASHSGTVVARRPRITSLDFIKANQAGENIQAVSIALSLTPSQVRARLSALTKKGVQNLKQWPSGRMLDVAALSDVAAQALNS